MSDELSQLEAELQQLRPRALSPAARARFETAGPTEPRPRAALVWLWSGVGAAAAVVMFVAGGWLLTSGKRPTNVETRPGLAVQQPAVARTPGAEMGRLVPTRALNVLFDATDGDVVRFADDTAARPVRLRYVDTITWRDPAGRASLQCTVPREEIYLVPVVAY
jgi:hypothetical protein